MMDPEWIQDVTSWILGANLDGAYMEPGWNLYRYLDREDAVELILDGARRDSAWRILGGAFMDRGWILCGVFMDPGWSLGVAFVGRLDRAWMWPGYNLDGIWVAPIGLGWILDRAKDGFCMKSTRVPTKV